MKRFEVKDLPLAGLRLITRAPIQDERGFLCRMYCRETFSALGLSEPINQINHTLTKQSGSVRGMHFQKPPHAETKIVSCIRGRIWDVAVDVRSDSSTFLQWHAEELSPEHGRALIIPKGFAHGLQTLEDDTEIIYFSSHPYTPDAETGLRFNDPTVGIQWPLPITLVSDRDRAMPLAAEIARLLGSDVAM